MNDNTKRLFCARRDAVLRNKPSEDASVHDKIRWLNAYDLSCVKVACVDKIEAKNVARRLYPGVECAKTIQTFPSVDDMDLSVHPTSFVLKKNSGCRRNIYCWNKLGFDPESYRGETDKWMSEVPGIGSDEFQYALVIPSLFTEECLVGSRDGSLVDYRFWVFENKCRFIAVNGGRGWGGQEFFDTSFNKMDLYNSAHRGGSVPSFRKPDGFERMVEAAEALSRPFQFVRVDLYNIGGKTYLGEFTFSPGGYFTRFVDSSGKSLDKEIGRYLHLP